MQDYRIENKRSFDEVIHSLMYNLKNSTDKTTLRFNSGDYFFDKKDCEKIYCRMSNHGNNNLNVCFALEQCSNIEIDGNGCFCHFSDGITPFLIRQCSNITLKNFKMYADDTNVIAGRVILADYDRVCIEIPEKHSIYLKKNRLFVKTATGDWELRFSFSSLNGVINDKEQNQCFGDRFEIMKKTIDENVVTVYNPKKIPKCGTDIIMISDGSRVGCGIFVDRSSNINLESIELYHSVGMGVLAQKSENVCIDALTVKRYADDAFSLNADATHFVNCKGRITVKNSIFENQLDDACNIHGIYTVAEKADKNKLTVRFMHKETKDIPIFDIGDEIQISQNDDLKPYYTGKIIDVSYNYDTTVDLTLDSNIEMLLDSSVVEVSSDKVDFVLQNCVIHKNRTRGLLLAAKGKMMIEGNYFKTRDEAIMFEANSDFWYESGGIDDVVLRGNVFAGSVVEDRYIIRVAKRKKRTNGFYYNRSIKICNNIFLEDCRKIADCNDTMEFVFENNTVYYDVTDAIKFDNIGKAIIDREDKRTI